MSARDREALGNSDIGFGLESAAFSTRRIDTEVLAILAELEKRTQAAAPAHTLSAREHRELQESGRGFGGPIRTVEAARPRSIRIDGRELSFRSFVPEHVQGVLLTIHGGGFVMGAAHHSDIRNWQIARHCSLAVVTPDYRLAPENPHPAALDDCEALALWLLEHASADFGSDRLLIGGESAGANLAVGVQMRLRDRHGYRFAGASHLFGWFDVGLSPSARAWGDRELILSTPFLEEMARCYVDRARHREPEISPLYANLEGLGSAQFTVGTLDPLLDDTLFMYARWLAAGNPARIAVFPGAVHAFTGIPSAIARSANQMIELALLDQLEGRLDGWR